jgi:hypothetical protein
MEGFGVISPCEVCHSDNVSKQALRADLFSIKHLALCLAILFSFCFGQFPLTRHKSAAIDNIKPKLKGAGPSY